MPIQFHPEVGTILVCDFNGFKTPEMIKRRPVVVLSPRFRDRANLCAIVPMSTTPPRPVKPYHYRLKTHPPLPAPYDSDHHWVKADMIYTVSFDRLFLPSPGKDLLGVRQYDIRVLEAAEIRAIQACALHGLGMSDLTLHL